MELRYGHPSGLKGLGRLRMKPLLRSGCGKIEEHELLVEGVSLHGDVSATLCSRRSARLRPSAFRRLLYFVTLAESGQGARLGRNLPVLLLAYGCRNAFPF